MPTVRMLLPQDAALQAASGDLAGQSSLRAMAAATRVPYVRCIITTVKAVGKGAKKRPADAAVSAPLHLFVSCRLPSSFLRNQVLYYVDNSLLHTSTVRKEYSCA